MTVEYPFSLAQLAQILSALENERRNPNTKRNAIKAIERNAAQIGLSAEDVFDAADGLLSGRMSAAEFRAPTARRGLRAGHSPAEPARIPATPPIPPQPPSGPPRRTGPPPPPGARAPPRRPPPPPPPPPAPPRPHERVREIPVKASPIARFPPTTPAARRSGTPASASAPR